jgi:hypothetical protein
MDLTSLSTTEKAESGFKMEIVNPATGVPVGATITIAGTDSKTYQDAQHKIANKRMKRMNSRGGMKFALTSEEVEIESIELLARCTLGWDNIDWEGSPLKFSLENAKMIYTELLWLREQCIAAMEDRSNFLQD